MKKPSQLSSVTKSAKIYSRVASHTGRGHLSPLQACLLLQAYMKNEFNSSIEELWHYVSQAKGSREFEREHVYTAAEYLVKRRLLSKSKDGKFNMYLITPVGTQIAESITIKGR